VSLPLHDTNTKRQKTNACFMLAPDL